MALRATNLLIQSAPIPATFRGTPDEFREELVKRMKIVSPSGTSFIFQGESEPLSNVGPWLKDGTKWYVWSEAVKRYVPQDITDSETQWYWIGPTTPPTTEPPVWFRTSQSASEANPFFGNALGWFSYNGTNWVPVSPRVLSGTTADRPPQPFDLQQYYDTDITALIWFERGAWRTVTGVPGDTKFVLFDTLSEALRFNPGWAVVGDTNAALRGRVPVAATKDAGPTPETVLTPSAGVTQRAAFEYFGENQPIQAAAASAVTIPPQLALWFIVKL